MMHKGIPLIRSLRFRLIASVVAIEVVMLSLLVWNNIVIIQTTHTDRLQETASSMLQQIANTSGSFMMAVDYAALEEYLRSSLGHRELRYLVVLDRDGQRVVSLGSEPTGAVWPSADTHPALVDDGVFDVAGDIKIAGLGVGRVLMGFSLSTMQQAISKSRTRGIIIAVTEIALTVLVTVIIGVRLTRRLGDLASAAQEVGAGDYKVVVSPESADEVGMTARAFNRMVAEVSRRTLRLEESLARERVIERTSIDGMVTFENPDEILSVNPAMTDLFGYGEQEMLGRPLAMLCELPTVPADRGNEAFNRILLTDAVAGRVEVNGLRRDGSSFPMELYAGRVDLDSGQLFAATLHDITERKRAEGEVRKLLDENRTLVHRSLQIQEEERKGLARELHDELGQCTVAVRADAESIRDLSKNCDERIEKSADAILSVSSRIYEVVHSMMQRLRPQVLDNLGLAEALHEMLGAWRSRHPGIQCEFDVSRSISGFSDRVNITVYRIIQEALTNISRHAEATAASVSVTIEGSARTASEDTLVLVVSDNGRGLDLSRKGGGLGIIGMRERVESLGGRFVIESVPEQSTKISASIPVMRTRQEGQWA